MLFQFGTRGLAPAEPKKPLLSRLGLHPPLVSLRGVAVQRPADMQGIRELQAAGPLPLDLLVRRLGLLSAQRPPGCPVAGDELDQSHG